jgi:hypothetical protein
MTNGGSLSLNPAAQNFELRADDVLPNAPQQRTPYRDTGDVLNN